MANSIYSFGGTPFGPLLSDWVTLPSYEVLSSIRQIVYADKAVLDIGGIQPGRYAVSIRVDSEADCAALEALRGSSGTLVIAGVSYPDSWLIKLTNKRMTPVPPPADRYWSYEAEWILGS